MNFNQFQDKCAEYDIVEGPANGQMWYYGLKLAGETGELAEKIGKMYRDGIKAAEGEGAWTAREVAGSPMRLLPQWFRLAIAKELGDVMWYVARIAAHFGFTLSEIAQINYEKLESRKQRGVLGGSGDNR